MAGGTGRTSKPEVHTFPLILTCSSLPLRTGQGKWAFLILFCFEAQHTPNTKEMFSSHGRAREEVAKCGGSGLEMIAVAGCVLSFAGDSQMTIHVGDHVPFEPLRRQSPASLIVSLRGPGLSTGC